MASSRCIQLLSFLAFVCLLNSAFSRPYKGDDDSENELNAVNFDDFEEDIPDEENVFEDAEPSDEYNIPDEDYDGGEEEEVVDDDDDDNDDETLLYAKDEGIFRNDDDEDEFDDEEHELDAEEDVEEPVYDETSIEEKSDEEEIPYNEEDSVMDEEFGADDDELDGGGFYSYLKNMYRKAKEYMHGLGK